MLNSLQFFLSFSNPGLGLNQIKWHPISKPPLLRGQPLQGLAAILQDIFCERHNFCGSVKTITHHWFDPRPIFFDDQSINGTHAYSENSRKNGIRKLGIRLKTHKHLRTESASYFHIKIQLSLNRCADCPLASEKIENQLSTHPLSPLARRIATPP